MKNFIVQEEKKIQRDFTAGKKETNKTATTKMPQTNNKQNPQTKSPPPPTQSKLLVYADRNRGSFPKSRKYSAVGGDDRI